MHDVEGRAGHPGEHDGPIGGLGLGLPWAGDPVVERVGLSLSQGLGHQDVDRNAVFGMHHDHRAVVRRRLHRPENLAVIAVEHAGVGHEQLETGDALVHEFVHGLERIRIDTTNNLVEAVIDVTVTPRLLVPSGQAVLNSLARTLHGKVDDGRGATPCRSPSTRIKGVGREGSPEGQLHVGVAVDAARDDVLPGGVDHPLRRRLKTGTE